MPRAVEKCRVWTCFVGEREKVVVCMRGRVAQLISIKSMCSACWDTTQIPVSRTSEIPDVWGGWCVMRRPPTHRFISIHPTQIETYLFHSKLLSVAVFATFPNLAHADAPDTSVIQLRFASIDASPP